MKKFLTAMSFLILILLSVGQLYTPAKAIETEDSVQLTMEEIEAYFETESIEYYAYLDMETADQELRQVIREAQCRIIFSTSWVADETNGWVLDENGNVIEVLPHFSQVFPADWATPTSEEVRSH